MTASITNGEIADAVDGAIDVLRFEGWVQGSFRIREKEKVLGYCTLGAVGKAIGGVEFLSELEEGTVDTREAGRGQLYRYTTAAISGGISEGCLSIDTWNDDPAMTKDTVINTLEHISKDLRNGEPV